MHESDETLEPAPAQEPEDRDATAASLEVGETVE